ncbi:hypothetical protein MMC25_006107 [Agyrium rufum]|nr:hypothetical protein [Agyrium rufum]
MDLLADLGETFLRQVTFPKKAEVDLVAVHGLNPLNTPRHGVKTWTAGKKGQEKIWLMDEEFLPQRLPNVRVLLFGYDANVAFNTSKAGVTESAENLLGRLKAKRKEDPLRPLVFIAHSLGGMVVKRALVIANLASNYATISEPISNIVRALGGSQRNNFMDALQLDSLVSRQFNEDFMDQGEQYRIWSFYETLPILNHTKLKVKVVEKQSATLGIGRMETRIPVHADHRNICKFSSPQDDNFDQIMPNIEEAVSWALKVSKTPQLEVLTGLLGPSRSRNPSLSSLRSELSCSDDHLIMLQSISKPSSFGNPSDVDGDATQLDKWTTSETTSEYGKKWILPEKRGPLFLAPYPKNEHFTGRRDVLIFLKQFMKANSGTRSIALYGLGGIGKSQIALALCYWTREYQLTSSVYWINARTAETFRQCFTKIVLERHLREAYDSDVDYLNLARDWLGDPENGPWFMVVDNADDNGFDSTPGVSSQDPVLWQLLSTIPVCDHGRILYITNNKVAALELTNQGSIFQIQEMAPWDTRALLITLLGNDGPTHVGSTALLNGPDGSDDLDRLSSSLEHLPLAIAQAAAYIRQNSPSVGEYLRRLAQESDMMENLLAHSIREPTAADHSKAAASTWKLCFAQVGQRSELAEQILGTMAYFDPQLIPRFLLHVEDAQPRLFTEAIGLLKAYSLLTSSESSTETYSMHRLAHITLKSWISSSARVSEFTARALTTLSASFPSGQFGTWEDCALALPHCTTVLQISSISNKEKILRGILRSKIAHHLLAVGDYQSAMASAQTALSELEDSLGIVDDEVLEVHTLLVDINGAVGLYDECETHARKVVLAREKASGHKSKEFVRANLALCKVYQDQGKCSKAVELSRKSVKILENMSETQAIEAYDTKAVLGRNLGILGGYDEAEDLGRDSLKGFVSLLSEKHPKSLQARFRLSIMLRDHFKFVEAQSEARQAHQLYQENYGPDHPNTLKCSYSLAMCSLALGRLEEAEDFLQELLPNADRILGSKHQNTLLIRISLGQIFAAQTRYQEALQLYRTTLHIAEGNLRSDHPLMLAARTEMALDLLGLRQYEEAEKMELITLKKCKLILGKKAPSTLRSRETLAKILWAQKEDQKHGGKKAKQAREQARKVLQVQEGTLGWRSPKLLETAEWAVSMLEESKEKMKLEEKITAHKELLSRQNTNDEDEMNGELLKD